MIVYKYPIDDMSYGVSVPWDEDTRVVLVAAQRVWDELPTIWVEHPDNPTGTTKRTFRIAGTGTHYDGEFVGSAVCNNGSLVWHVFTDRVFTIAEGD